MSQWQNVWKNVGNFRPSEYTDMFKFYEELLGDVGFKNKSVLEIGSGTGVNSLLMAVRGAKVTLVDYEKKALAIAREIAEKLSVNAEFVHGDIFDYDFENEFDIVHSEGVVEHFLGKKRQEILDIHASAVVRGGKCVVIVPNSSSFPYRLGKFVSEKAKTWIFGGEYPYKKRELIKKLQKSGLVIERVYGGEFLLSFTWLFSPLWLRYYNKFLIKSLSSESVGFLYKLNYNNPLANRLGRIIGVCGVKK